MDLTNASEPDRTQTSSGLWSVVPEDLQLFVGGVPSSLSNTEIKSHFEGFGSVRKFQRLPTLEKQESGCAILEIRTCFKQELLQKPHKIKSFLLSCRLHTSREKVPGKMEELQRKIFVSNLPTRTTDLDLYNTFSPFGQVEKAFVVKNRDGSLKNFGFVVFSSGDEKNKVISLNRPIRFRNRKLSYKQARDHESKTTQLPAPEKDKPTPPILCPAICSQASPLMQVIAISAKVDTSIYNYRFNFALTCPNHTL